MVDLGKTSSDADQWVKILNDNLITTVSQLAQVTDAQFEEMGFPVGLVNEIKKMLREETCSLVCLHGGVPDTTCTKCENCMGAWIGDLCQNWDPSSRSQSQLEADLEKLIASARDEWSKMNMSSLPGGIGSGFDITTGEFRYPVVHLTYSADKTYSWDGKHVFRLPKEAIFTVIPAGIDLPSLETFVFESFGGFAKDRFDWGAESTKRGGFFSSYPDLFDILGSFFSSDTSLAISQQIFSLYTLELPAGTSPKQYNLELTPQCQAAIDTLPPDISTPGNKRLYELFIQGWGTSFTTKSTNGGMIEMMSFFKTELMTSSSSPMSQDEIIKQVELDFNDRIGNPQNSHTQLYDESRNLSSLGCRGGLSAEIDCTLDNLKYWKNSIVSDPVPLRFVASDISWFVIDPETRTNIQKAINNYLQDQLEKWRNIDSCPDCQWGSCTQGNQYCDCINDHITGQTCSDCISGWEGDECNSAVCEPQCSSHGKCTAPTICTCDPNYIGTQCQIPPITCPVCGGAKVAQSPKGPVTCPACEGSGEVSADMELCPGCDGLGWVPNLKNDHWEVCPVCSGKGIVKKT